MARTVPAHVRAAVASRYGCGPGDSDYMVRCAYCSFIGTLTWFKRETQSIGWVATLDLEWEHIIPTAKGGPNTAENITLACRGCNRSKGTRSAAGFWGKR